MTNRCSEIEDRPKMTVVDLWEPTEDDFDWMENIIGMLKDNSVWVSPSCQSAYKFSKQDKVCTMIVGDVADLTNKKTHKLLKLMGWTMVNQLECN